MRQVSWAEKIIYILLQISPTLCDIVVQKSFFHMLKCHITASRPFPKDIGAIWRSSFPLNGKTDFWEIALAASQ
jgi:hypothetical protein